MRTKLVDCGSTIFVYDYESHSDSKEFHFENDRFLGELTNLKRLALKNFADERLLATFTLSMQLTDYKTTKRKLNSFIEKLKRSSGHSNIKYLAILKLPLNIDDTAAEIFLMTNIDFFELTSAVKKSPDDEEAYFSHFWGDSVYIEILPQEILLSSIDNAYRQSSASSHRWSFQKVFFNNHLNVPAIIWDEEADAYIKEKKLLDYPCHEATEIFYKIGGYVNVNVYSLYDTSFFTKELTS
ncbi:hypothetical protein [Heyndrickxia ginsengihumi]|uniref:hypothetical protein n=1 Tax=Heyndrickxia ginsengihumi TaxID=363870 RepID=UPI003D1BB1EB